MASDETKVIGGTKNFWLYSEANGYDLTHPPTQYDTPTYPRIPLETTKCPVAIDPTKTALVVVDMQNYFLSPLLGRPLNSPAIQVADKLMCDVIPACRKAGIRIIWVSWNLTTETAAEMPPAIVRGFGDDTNFKARRWVGDLGSNIGPLRMEDGTVIDGGRVLIRDQWNTALYGRLAEVFETGDITIHKKGVSVFRSDRIFEGLTAREITTLLFSGTNTHHSVAGSVQDAMMKGIDCLLLSDGCATASPDFTKHCVEFNVEESWGFVLTC